MKRLGLLGALLLGISLLAGVARAEETVSVEGRFIGGIGLGGASLVDSYGNAYSNGGGLDGYIGFRLDRNASLLLAVDSFIFPTNDPSIYIGEVNLVPSIKYDFGHSKTRFYLIGGLGLNTSIAYFETDEGTVSASEKNFVIEPGLGVDIFLNNALDLYIQAKYIDVFATNEFSYVPFSIGLGFK